MTLRPMVATDLPLDLSGESEFDDFGPREVVADVSPCGLDENGRLVVDDGGVAGIVSWRWNQWGPNAGSRCLMIGIWLSPSARGRGLGTAAQRELVDLIFRHTTVNRVEAHTDVDNLAEQRALEKAGFTREGLTRGAQWRNGGYRDGYLYAMLRAEWSAVSGKTSDT